MHVVGWALVAVALAFFVGALLQGVIGFGMVILAFPVLLLVEPELLPQSALVVSLPLVVAMAVRHRHGVVWPEVGWLTLGRPAGLIGAVGLLAVVNRDILAVIGGLVVLGAVVGSLWAPTVPRTPATLVTGGAVSSLFGTAIAIAGPPLGLLYQREPGERLRPTVSVLMLFGSPLSLLVLASTSQIDATDVRTGLVLVPFALAGNASARWVIPWFDERLRPFILFVCAVAAVFAVVRVVAV